MPRKSAQEIGAERVYNRILKEIVEPIVTNKITYGSSLERFGKHFIGSMFAGVFPKDQIPPLIKGEYAIVNTDPSTFGGEHWTAVYNDGRRIYFYDSFARSNKSIMPTLPGIVLNSDMGDAEQVQSEVNCGARSLAWLLVVKHFGIKTAMRV